VSKKSNEKTEPVHAIPGSDTWPKWLLENLDTLPRLDEVIRTQKKGAKRIEDGADLEKIIAELFHAIEELKCGRAVSLETFRHARELAESWHSEFGKSSNVLVVLLAGLVVVQKREIESFVKLRQLSTFSQREHKLTSKQKYDVKRRHVPVVGEIEWEFGGVRPPDTSDMNDSTMNCLKPPEPPTCLDDIFGRCRVNLQRLVNLFGVERHRLSKLGAEKKKRRKASYDYRTVVKIMDVLLSQSRKRKSSARGRPPKEPWLSDPPAADWRPVNYFWPIRHYCRSLRGSVREPLQTRVLTGIEARINSLSKRVPKDIKSAFLAVIRRHLIRVKNS
jgi:hypothetical protein